MREKTLFEKIEDWAKDRNLIEGSSTHAQMLKLTEEVGELAGAIAKNRLDDANDAVGDCVVVLTILAKQIGVDIEDCISGAYAEIKDRKGRMVDGVFVKE